MGIAQAILAGLNIAIPEVATLITIFRHKDGSATVVTELTQEAQDSAATQAMIAAWQAAHPAPASASAPTTTPAA